MGSPHRLALSSSKGDPVTTEAKAEVVHCSTQNSPATIRRYHFSMVDIPSYFSGYVDGDEVRSIEDLVERIIPHFEKYPLASSKRHDFENFEKICRMMYQGEHRSKEGLVEITHLAYAMNPSGLRKYSREEIKI